MSTVWILTYAIEYFLILSFFSIPSIPDWVPCTILFSIDKLVVAGNS
jgi:hypothetical protein